MTIQKLIAPGIAACLLAFFSSQARADVLYEHPFTFDIRESAWWSSCDGIARVWDQFDLVSDITAGLPDVSLPWGVTP